MDFSIKFYMLCILYMHYLGQGMVSADDPDCPRLQCDPRTIACQYRSFFANIATRKICRGCNVCIKQGSPVDSNGCPQLPCPKTLPPRACMLPWYYNSWVVYDGKQCRTCEALLCNVQQPIAF